MRHARDVIDGKPKGKVMIMGYSSLIWEMILEGREGKDGMESELGVFLGIDTCIILD